VDIGTATVVLTAPASTCPELSSAGVLLAHLCSALPLSVHCTDAKWKSWLVLVIILVILDVAGQPLYIGAHLRLALNPFFVLP
jgi:hypothetical protein